MYKNPALLHYSRDNRIVAHEEDILKLQEIQELLMSFQQAVSEAESILMLKDKETNEIR